MKNTISLKCTCGKMKGVATEVSSTARNRYVCLCVDCQTYAHYLGRAKDILDPNGGTEVLPVTPSNLKITQGQEYLQCVRLSPKGIYRWYAGCCKTPIANSPPSHKTPYAGVVHTFFDHASDGKTREELFGPIFARVHGRFGKGPLPPGTSQKTPLKVMIAVMKFMIPAALQKKHKPSPFFSDDGNPKVTPYVLTRAERDNFRRYAGPVPTA